MESQLQRFFDPAIRDLQLAKSWGKAGLLDTDNSETLNKLFVPLVEQHPQISSLMVADQRGHEYMLLHVGNKWMNRQTRNDEWANRVRILEWSVDQTIPMISWKELKYASSA